MCVSLAQEARSPPDPLPPEAQVLPRQLQHPLPPLGQDRDHQHREGLADPAEGDEEGTHPDQQPGVEQTQVHQRGREARGGAEEEGEQFEDGEDVQAEHQLHEVSEGGPQRAGAAEAQPALPPRHRQLRLTQQRDGRPHHQATQTQVLTTFHSTTLLHYYVY